MPKKPFIEDQENAERWLLTYADLITLLLAFFVVMYSMSRIDAKKFGLMQSQLSNVLRGGETVFPEGGDANNQGAGMLKIGDLKTIQWRIVDRLSPGGDDVFGKNKDMNIADAVSSEISERGLVIHIKDYTLFDSGKDELKPEAKAVLGAIADEMGEVKNHIAIEGHTDNVPIKTAKFPSNWELSSARATNVLRFLVETKGFSANRISARGFGEFRPIASNATSTGRTRNRRVDIVILSDQLTMIEPQAQDRIADKLPEATKLDFEDSTSRASVLPDITER